MSNIENITGAPPSTDPTAPPSPDIAIELLEQAARKRSSDWQETRDFIRVQIATGRFSGVPDEYARRNWVFVRVGLKGDPKTADKAEALHQKGYSLAPASVRAVGFEKYGDKTLIMCAPPDVARNSLADKQERAAVRRERLRRSTVAEIEAKLRDGLPRGASGNVAFTPVIGHGNVASFESDMRAAVRDVRRR